MKLKICTTKEAVTSLKKQATQWTDKELITRIYRELKKLSSQRSNDPMEKG
jgi:hypothetical protein